ncbi:MAG TPA: HD domain-containing protein, partial [bacterium (Candidatus Stahlbacteria)]|nr:HD domain-containing protein [Candidatus Stahlbacteria bacterium]
LLPEYEEYLNVEYRIPILKLAGLLHDLAKPDTRFEKDGELHFYGHDSLGSRLVKRICKEDLRLSNLETEMLCRLVREHMRPHLLAGGDLTDRAIRRFLRDLGDDFIGAMILAWADGKATAGKTRHLKKLYKRIIIFYRIEQEKAAFKLLINGYDLIELGLVPGPIFKRILSAVEEEQKDGRITTREEALDLARSLIKEEDDG